MIPVNKAIQTYKRQQSLVHPRPREYAGQAQVVEVVEAPRFEVVSSEGPQGLIRETYVLEREKEFHYYYGQGQEEKPAPKINSRADQDAQLLLSIICGFVGMAGFWVLMQVLESFARGIR
jgi:hypothetical protein